MNILQKDTWTKQENKDIRKGIKRKKTGKTQTPLGIGLLNSYGYILLIKKVVKK